MFQFRRAGQLLAAATATSLVFSGASVAGAAEAGQVSFSITNFTDFHGYLEQSVDADDPANTQMGAALMAAIMDFVGEDNDHQIRTTSGDNVGGSAFVSAISDDEYTLKALNEMGIDVSTAGNHEFDRGYDDLVNRIQVKSDYPILNANVLDADDNPALKPYEIFERDGVRVAVIGTNTTQVPNKVSPAGVEGLTFADPVATANSYAEELKTTDKADVVIVLQHDDIENVQGFNEHVDAAFGGDSHARHPQGDDNGTFTAQSQDYGKVISEYEFTFDTGTGEIVEGSESISQFDYSDEAIAALVPDATVTETVAVATAEATALGSEVLATTEDSFYRGSNPGAEPGSNRGVESTANNMLAESNRWAMDEFLGGDVIDLGLMNAGGVRSDLPAGKVTVQDAKDMQPFGNNLAYATLSGQAIIDALENQWTEGTGNSRPRLSLGVSDNVSYSYDPSQPKGERIINVTIDGEALDPAADYQVATATFLFEGGDGFIDPADVRDLTDVGYLDVTAFSDFLASDSAELREGQAEVGVVGLENLKAGEEVTLDLSSLNYSSAGEPMATTVTVRLGGVTQTAEIDNSLTDTDNGLGENGRATVTLDMPADVVGAQTLTITTDAGTNVSIPVTVAEGQTPGADSRGSSTGSDNFGLVAAVAAILAAIGGAVAYLFPAELNAFVSRF
ncbi:bifunctional metallophosphatase/5'-nucleotidase [Corynebacterium guangdongense]|uniref:5'-nucleotidase n=1 Tax=Corynebacterium guangdongense TaxID=1783348 RepID=A0ABU1ZWZ3_9CORY|nr:bifunctional UDP-sugar hydrolase/5'-nucleotidase [Corynebacterium guangdongense]MDR7329454.1 5'-nucleotidase [Corynebacterium guangdongense]WJZ18019.1 Endonuclease YhcR precursor [Corynebacterium guangdongense]